MGQSLNDSDNTPAPKIEPPKEAPPEASPLGENRTAFPDLKLPAPPKKTKEDEARYRKELDALLFKGVLPELQKGATLLQKVQNEQVRNGLEFMRISQDIIRLGRWDSSYLNSYLKMTDFYKVAAELQSLPADRVRCYELRILVLKDLERFIEIRVVEGNEPPQYTNLVQFHRLQAEADLLKLKEALKAAK